MVSRRSVISAKSSAKVWAKSLAETLANFTDALCWMQTDVTRALFLNIGEFKKMISIFKLIYSVIIDNTQKTAFLRLHMIKVCCRHIYTDYIRAFDVTQFFESWLKIK